MQRSDFELSRSERDTMRPMTSAELERWNDRQWPCCGASATTALRGPRGGLSINLACPLCDMRLNVIAPELVEHYGAGQWPFGPVIREPR
jgi:hypothetical protein